MVLNSTKNRLCHRANVELIVATPARCHGQLPTNPRCQKFRADFVLWGGLIAPNKYPDSIANSNRCGLNSSVAVATGGGSTPAKVCEHARRTAQAKHKRRAFIRRAYLRVHQLDCNWTRAIIDHRYKTQQDQEARDWPIPRSPSIASFAE